MIGCCLINIDTVTTSKCNGYMYFIKYSGACANIGASFLPLAFEVFGKTSDKVLKLVHDLVEKAAEIKQLSFSRLLSYWKRRIATTLQRENALFILNSSAHVLSATNRFDPECM